MLGKQEQDDGQDDDDDEGKSSPMSRVPTTSTSNMNHSLADAKNSGAFLSFSGDAEDEPVDLFASAQKAVEEMDATEQDEDDEAEPEDDFNAAWEVLDLARAIFEKQQDASDNVKLKLAEVFITLGDVSLETGVW